MVALVSLAVVAVLLVAQAAQASTLPKGAIAGTGHTVGFGELKVRAPCFQCAWCSACRPIRAPAELFGVAACAIPQVFFFRSGAAGIGCPPAAFFSRRILHLVR